MQINIKEIGDRGQAKVGRRNTQSDGEIRIKNKGKEKKSKNK